MPSHIHGIIIINTFVVTPDRASLRKPTLGQIVNQFKGSDTRWATKNGFSSFFAWQSRFYDHIIRNEKELMNIRKHIVENALKWDLEKNDQENICEM
jgi:REP element-mobilizing transposase RayT